MTLQKDFGVGLGTGERTHFRTLSKRTRERIEESVDRRNGYVVKEARKEIKKLKTKITTETEAHRDRAEKTKTQGKAVVYQCDEDHKGQLEYWHKKCCTLETKKAEQVEQHKMALSKMLNTHKLQEVSLPFSFRFRILPSSLLLLFTSHFICLDWDK